MRARVTAIAGAAALLLAIVGCSKSDTPPGPGPGNSGVDRTSAESTATAFANLYASGDVPAACELANSAGRENIGKECDSKQDWATTVTLSSSCPSSGMVAFHYKAAGLVARNTDLVVKVEKDGSGNWSVAVASTPASIQSNMMSCDKSSSGSSTSTAG